MQLKFFVRGGNAAALADYVGRVGFNEALPHVAKHATGGDVERAKKVTGKLKGLAKKRGTLAPEHAYGKKKKKAAGGGAMVGTDHPLFAKDDQPGVPKPYRARAPMTPAQAAPHSSLPSQPAVPTPPAGASPLQREAAHILSPEAKAARGVRNWNLNKPTAQEAHHAYGRKPTGWFKALVERTRAFMKGEGYTPHPSTRPSTCPGCRKPMGEKDYGHNMCATCRAPRGDDEERTGNLFGKSITEMQRAFVKMRVNWTPEDRERLAKMPKLRDVPPDELDRVNKEQAAYAEELRAGGAHMGEDTDIVEMRGQTAKLKEASARASARRQSPFKTLGEMGKGDKKPDAAKPWAKPGEEIPGSGANSMLRRPVTPQVAAPAGSTPLGVKPQYGSWKEAAEANAGKIGAEGQEKHDERQARSDKRAARQDASLKRTGEGSRGGQVIGHTKSGKAIYSEFGHLSHKDFTAEDHRDAAKAHADAAYGVNDTVRQAVHYAPGRAVSVEREGQLARAGGANVHQHDTERTKHEDAARDLERTPEQRAARAARAKAPPALKDFGPIHKSIAERQRAFMKGDTPVPIGGRSIKSKPKPPLEPRTGTWAGVKGMRPGPEQGDYYARQRGEGSRGGHVIGRTQSGKAIYDRYNHAGHKGFSKQDHLDAQAAQGGQHGLTSKREAERHRLAAKFPEMSEEIGRPGGMKG